MAVVREEKSSSMSLRVEAGTDTYKNRNISQINPTITDAAFKTVGDALGEVLDDTLDKVIRTDKATIAED